MGRRRTAAVLVAGCLTASACGGGHTATKGDVIDRGNAICAQALREIRALPPASLGAGSAGSLAVYLQHVVPIIHKEVGSLRALPRPARDRALLGRYLAAMDQTEAQYRAVLSAVRADDQAAISQALAALAAGPAPQLAQRYGLTQCASANGTAVSG